MELTSEQQEILSVKGNLKINAVAGSGKTTTLIEYAKLYPQQSILYLAFNKSVKIEAQKKFAQCGINHVMVHTAHSLAYQYVVAGSPYQIHHEYKLHELVDLLELRKEIHDQTGAYIFAGHVKKYSSYFCNNHAAKVTDLVYTDLISDKKSLEFVKKHEERIIYFTRLFLAKMNRGDIAMTHEFYLKKFQLLQPQLGYNIILFDEGQDASPVMLDIFLRQDCTRVIVGDVHQQIYGWRYAVNAMDHVRFTEKKLTKSFRFGSSVAYLAKMCLQWKNHLGNTNVSPEIIGCANYGVADMVTSRAVLARTNISLLRSALKEAKENRAVKKIYFEGNITSYTYGSEGTSIYDVLNLFQNKREYIRDPLIKKMLTFDSLIEYAEQAEDIDLLMIIDLVEEYQTDLPFLIKELKDMHTSDSERHTADCIFSTVHRAKGMEYDSVTLENDFITEGRIIKMVKRCEESGLDVPEDQIIEEINLLYVALTRAKKELIISPGLFPDIDIDSLFNRRAARNTFFKHSDSIDREIKSFLYDGKSIQQIAKVLKKDKKYIRKRITTLGLGYMLKGK